MQIFTMLSFFLLGLIAASLPLPLNEVFAYVAASRPEYDLQVFADNASQLFQVLSRENEQQKALSPQEISRYREQLMEIAQKPAQKIEQDFGIGINILYETPFI